MKWWYIELYGPSLVTISMDFELQALLDIRLFVLWWWIFIIVEEKRLSKEGTKIHLKVPLPIVSSYHLKAAHEMNAFLLLTNNSFTTKSKTGKCKDLLIHVQCYTVPALFFYDFKPESHFTWQKESWNSRPTMRNISIAVTKIIAVHQLSN